MMEITKNLTEKKIKISVIVLSYNHEKYIEEALKSVVNNCRHIAFEIIIYNDNSSDNTNKVIKN